MSVRLCRAHPLLAPERSGGIGNAGRDGRYCIPLYYERDPRYAPKSPEITGGTKMQIETLKQAGAIYLEQIQEGFDQCDWVEFTLDAGEAVDKLSAEWEACGKENAWADFYYFTLPDEAKEKIRESLTEEENRYLKELEAEEDGIIFPLEERLLRLLAKLNETEMLFSTFYFTNPASTWWGNYRKNYVVFREKK